jgi:hypothetical protein
MRPASCVYRKPYPEAKLAPPLGDPLRAKYLYWLFYAPGCLEPAMVQVATKTQSNPESAGGLGRCAAGVRCARCRADRRPVDPRRSILGRGYRCWIGAEFRGAAVQDAAFAPVIRPLHRSLRGAAGFSARECHRGGLGVPTANQARAYWRCSPPRIGRDRMRPAASAARDIGASLFNDNHRPGIRDPLAGLAQIRPCS